MAAIILRIEDLKEKIDEVLLGMCVSKYTTNEFLTRLVEVIRSPEQDIKSIFIDARLYSGPTKLEDYKQDCNSILECIDMFRLWSSMIEGFDKLKDTRNGFVIRDDMIVIIEHEQD